MPKLPLLSRLRKASQAVPWRGLIVSGLLVLALLEVGFVVSAQTSTGCSACHTPNRAVERQRATVHGDLECVECHRETGYFSLPLLNLRALRNFGASVNPWSSEPAAAIVSNRRCELCHVSTLGDDPVGDRILMSHREPIDAGIPCTRCHAAATHAASSLLSPRDHSSCSDCHDGERAAVACSTCHRTSPPRDKTALTGTEAIVHNRDWRQNHGMGDMSSCTICHARTYCKQCHGIELPHSQTAFPYLHGDEALAAGNAACTQCHQAEFCNGCHGIEMPHAEGFLAEHVEKEQELGRETCDRCHVPNDCRACHEQHVHPGIPQDLLDELRETLS